MRILILGAGQVGGTLAENLANEVLSLPIGPHLRPEQVTAVVQGLREFMECHGK